MMSTSSSMLPTTPIGKQQVIDLKAGAILRENARKSGQFFGCPLSVVLVLIILIKCLFISFWIIREYETFDFRCSAWGGGGQIVDSMYRTKRWINFYGFSQNSNPKKLNKNWNDGDGDYDYAGEGDAEPMMRKKRWINLNGYSQNSNPKKQNKNWNDGDGEGNYDYAGEGNAEPMIRKKRMAQYEKSDPRKFSKTPDDDDDDNSKTDVINKEKKKKKPLYGRSTSTSTDIHPPKIDPRLDFGPLPPNFQRRIDSNHIPDVGEDEDDLPMTTMVTLTNTQIVQLSGEDTGVVKMKTIRNRVEKVGSDEEQFIEIDIANAPRIYVSKIKSRHGGEEEEQFDLLKELKKDEEAKEEKKKKKKGKGLKNAKKLAATENPKTEVNTTSSETSTTTTKKPKGKGLKKLKKQKTSPGEEVTKLPRHLVGKSSSMGPTTPKPKSSWINGVVDPQDPMFSNQGQIRGYPMQKASKKPSTTTMRALTSEEEKENLKISESTRMMWDMDELKYTTFLAPKTTEQTKMVEENTNRGEDVKFKTTDSEGVPKMVTSSTTTTTTEKPLPGGMSKHEWEQKKEEFEAYTPSILTSDLQPSHSGKSSHSEVSAPYHVHLPSAPTTSTSSPNVPNFHFIPPSSEAPYYVEVNDADTETIYVKDVTPMFRNAFMGQDQQETTTRPYDPLHLEMEIAKLKESSTCLARMAFDVWCLFVLFSSVLFIMGICVPRWSLFVLHIVFDFLFLVVGFVTSLTIAFMSSIMYFLIDEMTSDSLFEFLLVAFVIDIILILYSIIVGISYRCCCRLVDNTIKETSINYSVSSNGEPV
ncbi:hypothetical protein CRE_28612 [Caenorhabditis remanei]|uniref:Uncharacterized protein n=1 Tax=Caenorhabditis remanei TaxID=31234 RepID=E3LLV6_CAERE|nr:hypothetical protein CRE_28612 [Caenorhabditis remanei]